jgi:hypothetical protein
MADRPLHLIMRDAHLEKVRDHPGWRAGGEAAMLRAIADEMPMIFDPWLQEHADVAAWLLSEAARAEAGRWSDG